MSVEKRLEEMGIVIPDVAKPLASYVPAVLTGNHVYTSGQVPLKEGKLRYTGKVGKDLTLEEGVEAARVCVLNALAAVKSIVGSLDRVSRVVKLTGFVACSDDFTDQPKVMNGASDLLGEIFGEAGKHARSALGTNALPLNVPVELELLVEIKETR